MSDAILAAPTDNGVPVSLRSSRAGWQGFGASLLAIRAGTYRIPAAEHHRIGVHIGSPVRADCVCDGERVSRIQAHGDVDVIPAGLPGQWTDSADCQILHIALSDTFVRRTVEQLELKPSQGQIRRRLQVRDPRLQHRVGDGRRTRSGRRVGSALCGKPVHGARRAAGRRPAGIPRAPHARAPKAAARVIDYVEANLERRMTLAELAALVSISVPHFRCCSAKRSGCRCTSTSCGAGSSARRRCCSKAGSASARSRSRPGLRTRATWRTG